MTGRTEIGRLRGFLIRLLIGKTSVIANARIKYGQVRLRGPALMLNTEIICGEPEPTNHFVWFRPVPENRRAAVRIAAPVDRATG
jgi:hypothetical protein